MFEEQFGVSVGKKAVAKRTISERDVTTFADLSGDTQGLHLDDGYASKTRFKGRIAHGTLSIGLISAVLGTRLANPETTVIFLGLNIRFTAPVYLGDTVTAECEVTQIREDRRIVTLACKCTNQNGKELLTGEATVLLDPLPFTT